MLPEDFKSLLPKLSAEPETGPLYWLWVYDPHEDKVHLEHNEGRHRADYIDHGDLADRVPHPDRVHGYAYRIRDGFRITTVKHGPVDDPHILRLVERSLKGLKRKSGSVSQAQLRVLPSGRIAAVVDPDNDAPGVHHWMNEHCADFACALQERYPHLRFGDTGSHVFVHDDNHAYDASGKHPIPQGDHVWLDLDRDFVDDEHIPDLDMVKEAHQQIESGLDPVAGSPK